MAGTVEVIGHICRCIRPKHGADVRVMAYGFALMILALVVALWIYPARFDSSLFILLQRDSAWTIWGFCRYLT